jgi:hypothetical protein
VIARTTGELMFNYIQRGLERGLARRVIGIQLSSKDEMSGPQAERLSATVALKVIGDGLGVKVSARVTTLPTRAEGEETLLLSPTIDYGELDQKLSEFALRIAKKIAELNVNNPLPAKHDLPRGIVRFYCVIPADANNSRMQALARRLTLELPFYLTEAGRKQNLDLAVLGLDFKEALSTCETVSVGPATSTETRFEGFSWYGILAEAKSGRTQSAQLAVRTRNALAEGNARPLAEVTITDASAPDLLRIAGQVMQAFVTEYRANPPLTSTR